jgi:hypothetical protein
MEKFDPNDYCPSPQDIEEVLTSKEFNYKPGSIDLSVAKILLFTVWAGEDIEQLSALSGVPLDQTCLIATALRATNVFGKGINHREEYFAEEGGGTALSLDICCAMGLAIRTGGVGPSATFKLTQAGIDSVHRDLIVNPEARAFMDRLKAKGKRE